MSSSKRIQTHRKRAFERQGGCCHYCGVRMWLVTPDELPVARRSAAAVAKLRCTAEHLVAQCDGGTNAAACGGFSMLPGESFMRAAGSVTAWPVAGGSTDTITITNASGSLAAAYRVVVIGATA